MFGRGGFRGEGGGGGGVNRDEWIACHIHGKRRPPHQLVNDPQHPGKLRCDPRRECRNATQADDSTWCTCRSHGRRRNIAHMKEVAPGVYECVAPHLCHSGPNPHHGDRRQHRRFPQHHHQHQQHHHQSGMYRAAGTSFGEAPVWMPVVPISGRSGMGGGGGGGGGFGGGRHHHQNHHHGPSTNYFAPAGNLRMAPPAYGYPPSSLHGALVEVWCARHGKFLPQDAALMVDDIFYMCREAASACLSAPLEPASALRQTPQAGDILCRKHSTLRSTGFVVLCSDGLGYECDPKHPCSSVDTHSIDAIVATAEEEVSAAGPLPPQSLWDVPSHAEDVFADVGFSMSSSAAQLSHAGAQAAAHVGAAFFA